jgi:hypothetical protein
MWGGEGKKKIKKNKKVWQKTELFSPTLVHRSQQSNPVIIHRSNSSINTQQKPWQASSQQPIQASQPIMTSKPSNFKSKDTPTAPTKVEPPADSLVLGLLPTAQALTMAPFVRRLHLLLETHEWSSIAKAVGDAASVDPYWESFGSRKFASPDELAKAMRIHLGGGLVEQAYFVKVIDKLNLIRFPELPTPKDLEAFFALCEELPKELHSHRAMVFRLAECMPASVRHEVILAEASLAAADRHTLAHDIIAVVKFPYAIHSVSIGARPNVPQGQSMADRATCRHCGLPAHYGRGCRKQAQLALPPTRPDFSQGGHQ